MGLNCHRVQPHIFSKFIFHQQNKKERTLLELHTEYLPIILGGGGRAFIGHQGGSLLTFFTIRVGVYSNKYGKCLFKIWQLRLRRRRRTHHPSFCSAQYRPGESSSICESPYCSLGPRDTASSPTWQGLPRIHCDHRSSTVTTDQV